MESWLGKQLRGSERDKREFCTANGVVLEMILGATVMLLPSFSVLPFDLVSSFLLILFLLLAY